MNKGILTANKLIDKYCITKPNEIPIEDIIANEGCYLIEKSMKNAEGRIISIEGNSLIIINSNIADYNKKRFIMSHEFGHFLMHKKLEFLFTDDEALFWNWFGNNSYENEANQFASELLMPEKIFLPISKKNKFSIKFLEQLKDEFATSFMATAIKFAEVGYDPILLICSKDNTIKWFVKNKDFPFTNVYVNSKVPQATITSDYYLALKEYDSAIDIDPVNWNIDAKYLDKNLIFLEQCVYFKHYNYVLTFIWLENK